MKVAGVEITGMTADSRRVEPGMLFAAIPGTVADGRDYIDQAVARGASVVLSTPGLELGVPYVAADEPRLAYAELAAKLHPGRPETIVAMTGTNGKSSTVEFLRQIWSRTGHKAACFGTLGVTTERGVAPMSHTTPDAVQLHKTLSELAAKGVTHAAMEASSHGLKQYRMHGVRPDVAGFSNLTQDHFDYHPTVEDYFDSKSKLFTELLPAGAPAVITTDDEAGRKLADMCREIGHDVRTIGWGGADIRIDEIIPRAASQGVTLVVGGKRYGLTLPLAGEFQALNAVCAVALAVATGVDLNDAIMAAEMMTGVPGRLEPVGRTRDGAPVFVDFAHTEDGLDKLLRSVRPHTMGRIVCVFGCGGDRDATKRAPMGATACRLADSVIVTDDNPRSEDPAAIRAEVLAGCATVEGCGATEIGDRAAAIREGLSRLGQGDCLVIAGKGHEQGQIVGDTTIPFSDQSEVRAALEEQGHA